MIARIKDALGSVAGSLLGILILVAIAALPVFVVLWIGSALGAPWAIDAQVRVAVGLSTLAAAATELLPAWAWFILVSLLWLAFLDVQVRALVRDEIAKYLTANERKDS